MMFLLTLLLALWRPGTPASVALAHALLGAGHPEVVVALVVHPGSEVVPAHPELTVLQRLQLVAVQVCTGEERHPRKC